MRVSDIAWLSEYAGQSEPRAKPPTSAYDARRQRSSRWTASWQPRAATSSASSTPVKGWIVIVRAVSTIVKGSDARRGQSRASKVKSRKPIATFCGYQLA